MNLKHIFLFECNFKEHTVGKEYEYEFSTNAFILEYEERHLNNIKIIILKNIR